MANKKQVIYHTRMILDADFYCRNPMTATRGLLGTWLCREMPDGQIVRARIAEVELYHQCERGCHAFDGRCTPRNDAMFMSGGHAYVYLCYGMHNMLNIVLGDGNTAVAALVRALEMAGCDGPGKLCKMLSITRADNKLDLTAGKKMWLESGTAPAEIVCGPRIGVDYAGADAALPWRFGIAGSVFLSRPF